MQKYEFDIIGTHLIILLDSEDDFSKTFDILEKDLIRFEEKYSRFIEWNWLYELNMARSWILDQESRKMITFMLEVAKKSSGYFDPTVWKRLTELWYGNKKIATKNNLEWFWDYRDIEVIWDVITLHGDILLEFGGVGKWYLIDVLKKTLCESGATTARYLINFWWDLYGKWWWKVGLESPFASDEVIWVIDLEDDFLACSAWTKRKWGNHHHLIDPHTWISATEVVASYVEGDSGMIADAYATTLCVMSWKSACKLLEETPEISGVLVSKEGNIDKKRGSRSEIFD